METKKLLEKVSVSLLLDSYDAIFSDFDPRGFQDRAVSDDFMMEARKVLRENEGGSHELHFLVPKNLRNEHSEVVIKERLHRHFRKKLSELERETRSMVVRGVLLIILGMLLMFGVSLVSYYWDGQSLWISFLKVVMEPAGWFMSWFGFDQVFYYSGMKKDKLKFFRQMVKAELKFDVY